MSEVGRLKGVPQSPPRKCLNSAASLMSGMMDVDDDSPIEVESDEGAVDVLPSDFQARPIAERPGASGERRTSPSSHS